MTRQKKIISVGVGAAVLSFLSTALFLTPALAAPTKDAPKREGFNEPFVLAHLKRVKVVVGTLDSFATSHGASQDHIKQLVTDGLSPMHISTADGDGGKGSKDCGPSDTPLMYVKLKVSPDGDGTKDAACSVSLSLVEKAKISRNKKDLMVSVWREEAVGKLNDNVKEGIDKQVENLLKNFHRDYMLANSSDSASDVPEHDHDGSKASKKFKPRH